MSDITSDLWNSVERRGAGFSPAGFAPSVQPRFVPWHDKYAEPAAAPDAADASVESGLVDTVQLQADAFSEGFNEGRRTVEMEVAAERQAIARLVETLEQYRPEPPQMLAEMLAETVDRLVRQIVGEVVIDRAMLETRVDHVAGIIAEAAAPARMRLHPDDVARLGNIRLELDLVADPALIPGSVIVETATGWIEDGPEVGIEKLRQALDRMSVPQ
ncbi:FliH/SctL family protein [Sphingomonas sp. LaA6.9]|uniref:FliH/SctL family protein n=1 Tax=Sphingomonas sp. LaA6.9 TaxID=2919914 RepID=UPI001F502865|nr:FliH/SctL family protein [Sphingomonas sp. LaA6.9]MCJ8156350.1 hypothetical protein [Sphingomonas sp. LaA6.9]